MPLKTYNKKGFLLPDSASSMACYHAKIDEQGVYKLTIHDCNSSIRLWGDLTDGSVNEALAKLKALETAIRELHDFIDDNYNNYHFKKHNNL